MISPPAECTPRASSRSIHSPDSRVSRPTRNRSRAGPVGRRHRTDERRAEPRDGLVVERVVAGLAANAVSAEQSMGHESIREWPRVAVSLDGYVDHGWIDGADPEALGLVDLDAEIVPAGTEPGKVHERVDFTRPHRPGERPRPAHGDLRQHRRQLRAQARGQVALPHGHAGQLALDRRRAESRPSPARSAP